LIEAFKILKNIEDVEYQDFIQLAPDHHSLRGYTMKLIVPHYQISVKSKFFSRRVLKEWSSLPQHVIDGTTNTFKNRLDAIWSDMSN